MKYLNVKFDKNILSQIQKIITKVKKQFGQINQLIGLCGSHELKEKKEKKTTRYCHTKRDIYRHQQQQLLIKVFDIASA